MLIIEGADLVGKSTLVEKIFEHMRDERLTPHMPMHLTRPGAAFDPHLHYKMLASLYTIWDRFHTSALVYRQFDDLEFEITPEAWKFMEMDIRLAYGAYVVVLTTDEYAIADRYHNRGDKMYNLDRIQNCNSAYIDIARGDLVQLRGKNYCTTVDKWIHHEPGREIDVPHLVDDYLTHLDTWGWYHAYDNDGEIPF